MAKLSMPLLLPASRAAAAACRQYAGLSCCHDLVDRSSSHTLQSWGGIAIHRCGPRGSILPVHQCVQCCWPPAVRMHVLACSERGEKGARSAAHALDQHSHICCKDCTASVHLLAGCCCRCVTSGRRLLWRSEAAPSTSKSLKSQAGAISISGGDAYVL